MWEPYAKDHGDLHHVGQLYVVDTLVTCQPQQNPHNSAIPSPRLLPELGKHTAMRLQGGVSMGFHGDCHKALRGHRRITILTDVGYHAGTAGSVAQEKTIQAELRKLMLGPVPAFEPLRVGVVFLEWSLA